MSGHAKAASADLAAKSPHDVEIPGFTASNDEQLSKRKADVEIPGFTASNDASRQPGAASLLDTGIPGFTDNGVKERQIPRFTFTDSGVKERQIPRFPQKGMRNRHQSKRKKTAEKEHLGYSDCLEDTANAIEKALNDKRLPRIWITEDIWMHYIRGNTKNRERFSSDVSIFKVRMFLKDIKREAYVPQQVSLGPYHEGRPDLPPMKHHKGRALRRMMSRRNKRTGNDSNDMDFAFRARNEILKLEDKISGIYQEPILCDREMLARMVFL